MPPDQLSLAIPVTRTDGILACCMLACWRHGSVVVWHVTTSWENVRSASTNQANSAFHPSGVGKWVMWLYGLQEWRPLYGRPELRMAVWSQVKVRRRGLSLRLIGCTPALYMTQKRRCSCSCGLWRYNVICLCLIGFNARRLRVNEDKLFYAWIFFMCGRDQRQSHSGHARWSRTGLLDNGHGTERNIHQDRGSVELWRRPQGELFLQRPHVLHFKVAIFRCWSIYLVTPHTILFVLIRKYLWLLVRYGTS